MMIPMTLRFAHCALGTLAAAFILSGCGWSQVGIQSPAGGRTNNNSTAYGAGKIKYVVVLIQENRTVDNLFNGLPGADTVKFGLGSKGAQIRLQPEPLAAHFGLRHNHAAFLTEWNNGGMNGFDELAGHCSVAPRCPPNSLLVFGYVPHDEVRPYFDMAERYTFADRMFESSQGPSFPAHQYLVSGTSTNHNGSPLKAAENATKHAGGCDSPRRTTVPLIDAKGEVRKKVFPCFERTSIFTLLDDTSVSWRYYQEQPLAGVWNAVDALKPIWQNRSEYSQNVIAPSKRVLTDIAHGKLAQVVMVTPSQHASDHAGDTDGSGPDWIASIVNAIGESPYWSSTAIFITWDDWGGWYDHVSPTIYNSYELGMRVPLIVVSPYAKSHYVSHVPYEFGSILKFTEQVFGLPSLGTTDVRANDLSDCFDFTKAPRRFRHIHTQHSAQYFLRQLISNGPPDDD
jgi:phospholipase C